MNFIKSNFRFNLLNSNHLFRKINIIFGKVIDKYLWYLGKPMTAHIKKPV